MRKGIRVIVAVVVLCMFSVTAYAQTTILQEKNFETSKGGLLTVQVDSSDVSVSVWNKDRVMVTVRGLKRTEKVLDIAIQKTDGGGSVTIKRAEGRKILGWGGARFTSVDIIVPESYGVRMNTSGGDIKINNVSGVIELDSGGGDISLVGTGGDLRAFSSGGDISISSTNGSVDLSSSGGDIRAVLVKGPVKAVSDGGDITLESSSGSVSLYSAAGDIAVSYQGDNEGIEARTTRGAISLAIPGSMPAALSFNTGRGNITTTFSDATVFAKSTVKYEGEINGGGKEILLRTDSGSITATGR